MSIRRDDNVIVISGVDKGKIGKVIAVSPEEGKVIVSKVHVVKKHAKPRRQGETGGILEVEGAIYADKVALYCPNCKKGVRTHVEIINDKKVRVCSGKGCGHKFD
ncbi:MAG: 50S ribosomal protein L24 [Ruminococcaceae bacterium]|nr:50S ribosomal protein L24 [Oscillospiraceae bacterium]